MQMAIMAMNLELYIGEFKARAWIQVGVMVLGLLDWILDTLAYCSLGKKRDRRPPSHTAHFLPPPGHTTTTTSANLQQECSNDV